MEEGKTGGERDWKARGQLSGLISQERVPDVSIRQRWGTNLCDTLEIKLKELGDSLDDK